MISSTLNFGLGLLLLANCSLYACNAGYLGADGTAGREPARVANQLNAPSIRLIAPPGQPAAGSSTGAGAGKSAPGDGAPVPTVPLAPPPGPQQVPAAAIGVSASGVAATAGPLQCVEIGNFDVADARRFDQQLAALALTGRASHRSVQDIERYIVYIPPQGDKENAERKAGELRRLGVNDFYVFNNNSELRWGISLGVFKTAEAARTQLASLAQKGVRTAKIAPQPGSVRKTAYQLRGLDADAQAALAKIRAAFPRQEERACAPA